jgi:acyl-CoA reductase-like NAD-dependent aldehyde dehydrogenase
MDPRTRPEYSPPQSAMETETKRSEAEVHAPPAGDRAGADRVGEALEVHNPADGSVVATVPVHGAEDVREAAVRVRAGQAEWEGMGHAERYRWLGRWRNWMLANADRIADVLQEETGKVRHEAGLEVPGLADAINFYGRNSARFLADEVVRPHAPLMKTKALKVTYRPFPVVGVIAPWNFPLLLSAGDAIPALAAGCAVIIKPSEFTPLSLLELVRGWKEEVGGPEVVEVVTGLGETGAAVVDESDFVHFTGSVATGKKVMARAAETLTPVSLELGGKDPLIVLDDADPERAANGAAWGGLANSGQICISVERVYVTEPVYDRFLDKLLSRVSKLRQGPDEPQYTHEIGAMTSPAQVKIVEEHIRDALERGAKVLTGGRRREGAGDYFEPTVLVDVDHSMKIMREETFGPVIPVMRVRDEDEAVRLANDSRYGLSASVFGEKEHAEAVARRLESGACNVNDVMVNYLALDVPMGGWKESGIGSRWGPGGIRKYCHTESLVISRLAVTKAEPLWFPYSPRKGRILGALGRFLNARGLRNRLGMSRRD